MSTRFQGNQAETFNNLFRHPRPLLVIILPREWVPRRTYLGILQLVLMCPEPHRTYLTQQVNDGGECRTLFFQEAQPAKLLREMGPRIVLLAPSMLLEA